MVSPTLAPPSRHQVLDPRTLGRPVHLLPAFALRFSADLAEFLRGTLNRRYGMQLLVSDATMTRQPQPDEARRWHVYESATGRIGLALDRSLVLRVLQCRYGLQEKQQDVDLGTVPVNASEERLTQRLGQEMVMTLMSRIRHGLQQLASESGLADGDQASWRAESSDAAGAWWIKVRLGEARSGLQADLRFSLDDAWMNELLSQLAGWRSEPKEPLKNDAKPLASRIQVKLVAQLLQRRMALGDILDFRVGNIIPVSLQTTDVLVKNSRLFTATVAEHKGKLWLTAFNDTK